ncbi:hypothetical protein KJ567_03730 [Candidatus Bipolaricaulota bacterium]|nr:hypothetical protein [Candidatus Bipolaricaulota bacterium]
MGEQVRRRDQLFRIVKIIALPLIASCIGIGIAFSLMYVGSEHLYEDATTGRRAYQTERFRLWIEDASPAWMEKEARADELERLLDELLAEYAVDEAAIPVPIDVFLHETVDSFRHNISVRKGANSRFITPAPLDLLLDESPRGRLGELVLTFGWGRTVSRVFQVGMSLVMSHPDYSFHAIIAGLSDDQLLDLDQVLLMESRGRLPSTIYHSYDSPHASAMLGSLTDLRTLMGLEEGHSTLPDDLASLEAASICQFVVETLGVAVMRDCWDRGDTAELLRTRTGYEDLGELGRAWMEYAKARGVSAPQYEIWRVRSDLAAGRPDSALATLAAQSEGDSDAESVLVYALTALAAGDLAAFDDARALAARLDMSEEGTQWLDAFVGAVVVRGEGYVGIGPALFASEIEDAVRLAEATRVRTTDVFGLPVPEPRFVHALFFYEDRARATFGAALAPVFKNIRTQGHYYALNPELPSAIEEDTANAALASAYGEMSYSQLLRVGATHLTRESEADLLEYGAQLVRDARWHPLHSLQIGSVAEDVGLTEAALLVRHVVKHCGVDSFEKMWVTTAATTQFYSLDSALRSICGMSRRDVETLILEELLGGG